MKAGIVIDDWKLGIFKKHLNKSKYQYEVKNGITKDTLSIFVEFENVGILETIVKAANDEAATSKQTLH